MDELNPIKQYFITHSYLYHLYIEQTEPNTKLLKLQLSIWRRIFSFK